MPHDILATIEENTINASITQNDIVASIQNIEVNSVIEENKINAIIEPIEITAVINNGVIDISQTFETISKNLKSYPASLNYTSGSLTSIVYTLPSGTITKTLNYVSGVLSSIVLSGNTPDGISLTKTLNYTAGQLLSISYS